MSPLPHADMERVYEILAVGIDRAGPAHEPLFLAKLALLLARQSSSPDQFAAAVETALLDLDHPTATERR